MQAIIRRRYGPPDALELQEIDPPTIGDREVLVRVRGAGVNPADWHFMRGRPFVLRLAGYGLRSPKRPGLGSDVAGVVEAVGPAVTRLRAGDAVFGWGRATFAELASAREDRLEPMPAALSFEAAAAIPLAAVTALQGLRDTGRLTAGQSVMIVGASGGVGSFAVQIAKALGAEVTGVCSTPNVDLVRSIGADHVIDRTREAVVGGGRRYDLIFQLGGTLSPGHLRRALAPTGTLVLSSGDGRFSGIDRIVMASLTSPFVGQRLVTWVASENGGDLATIAALIESGAVRPVIERTYRLREAAAAMAQVETGHTRGKVVIVP
jgi:NADPH:quinone reductase-like Zn-dependent oxidoreductase